jgi:hypothetical protein
MPEQSLARRASSDFASELVDLVKDAVFGDVRALPVSSRRGRSLVTAASLTTFTSFGRLRNRYARAKGCRQDRTPEIGRAR